ncbi:MAG: hypothetical protein ACTHJM_07935, partial [Marmoricola sp.]
RPDMSILTTYPRVTKTSHTAWVAAGLATFPLALLALAAYASDAVHAVGVALATAASHAHMTEASLGATFGGIIAVIAVVIGLAVKEHFRAS